MVDLISHLSNPAQSHHSQQADAETLLTRHRQAVALMPDNADTHYNLGVSLYQDGQLPEATTHYRHAIKLNPKHISAHANLGLVLFAQGQLEEAMSHYQQALQLNPDHVNANNGLAVAFYHKGQFQEAACHCQRAIALQPGCFSAYNNLGTVLQRWGRLDEAMGQYQKALALNPSYASAYDNLGTIYQERGNLAQAIVHYRQAIACDPNSANAYNNLGSALKEVGDLQQAIACCQRAIQLQPSHADAHNNYGSSLVEQGNLDAAIAHYETALQHNPDHVNAHLNLGIILLMLGDFKRGFVEYHWRWRSQQCPPLKYPRALWDGSDLTGKTIVLTAEQGLGDTIQFARYAPLVAARGGRVIVACQKPLLRLLETLPGVDHCVDRNYVNAEVHYHAPLLDLPLILGTTVATIPAHVPYLQVPPAATVTLDGGCVTEAIATQVTTNASGSTLGYKIGFVWASNPDNSTAKKRSCPLQHFLSLLDVPGVQLYSLQKEPSASDQALLEQYAQVVDLRDQIQDFGDTAAAIAQLDLVISVDTAVAHLAGALGHPVWTLLPFVADWRWLVERQDTPWYPSMRLFRQTQARDWETVFQQVRQALEQALQPEAPLPSSLPVTQLTQPSLASELPLNSCRYGLFLLDQVNSAMGQSLELYGEWMEQEVPLLRSLLRSGDGVVELGAGIGAHTLFFAQAVGRLGKVMAFEPNQLAFQSLCANLALNGVTNTHAFPLENFNWFDRVQRSQCQLIKVAGKHLSLLAAQAVSALLPPPVLYLEDVQLEEHTALIAALGDRGYDFYWHCPRLYNVDNFRQNSQNVFGETVSANLLGFHRAQGITVEGMKPLHP